MDFITAKEAARNWNMAYSRVAILCSESRIDGAEFIGNIVIVSMSLGLWLFLLHHILKCLID
jgi:hypothetical protein